MSNLNFLHSGGNKVTLSTPDNNPSSDLTLKLPQADGTNGQFLKTNGSGALSFATPSYTQTYTEYSTLTVGGANSYAVAITGDPKVFEVSLFEVRHVTNMNIMYRLSNSGGETTSGYYDVSTYHQAGGNDVCTRGLGQSQGCLVNYDFTGADNLMTGKAIFTKVNTGLYTFSAVYNMRFASGGGNDQYILTSSGHLNNNQNSGSTVTQFRIFTSGGGNFTSGTINVRGIL